MYSLLGSNILICVFVVNCFQINEEASDKVLEVEQKYNVVRKPVYDKRSEVIKAIPDFWLTAVSDSSWFVASQIFCSSNLIYSGSCSFWVTLFFLIFWVKKTKRLNIKLICRNIQLNGFLWLYLKVNMLSNYLVTFVAFRYSSI